MGDVLNAYSRYYLCTYLYYFLHYYFKIHFTSFRQREEVTKLRSSINDITEVLTSKKKTQQNSEKFSEMWLRKVELEESLRMLSQIEFLKVIYI
jgi:hypothetical protein